MPHVPHAWESGLVYEEIPARCSVVTFSRT